MTARPPRKPTRAISEAAASLIKKGHTLSEAAAALDLDVPTFFDWFSKGGQGKPPYYGFTQSLSAAYLDVQTRRLKGNSRTLSRDRYERGLSDSEFEASVLAEVLRMMSEGRVPLGVAERGLEMALDSIRDQMADRGVSWADGPTLDVARQRPSAMPLDED